MSVTLCRDQQQLLGAAGAALAASALLDKMRERTTLEGGCSAAQPNCWISYNRKAIWLEDHSGFSEAIKAVAGADQQAKNIQAPAVGQGIQFTDRCCLFHRSNIHDMSAHANDEFLISI